MTNYTNKTLLRDRKRWWIERIDKLDNRKLGEQKCTQKIGILPGPTKKWRIKRIDELNEFYYIIFTNISPKKKKTLKTFYYTTLYTYLNTGDHASPVELNIAPAPQKMF